MHTDHCRIHKLQPQLIAQIAAGEVIENPVSVLKELLENSIDARANKIRIYIKAHGFERVQVIDNGIGIHKEDIILALESFATSKLNKIDDIYRLDSLGFRGEALGSISSVAHVLIESRHISSNETYCVSSQDKKIVRGSLPSGTKIDVEDLFYNTPVRKEFQKSLSILKKRLHELVTDFALAYHDITFEYYLDNKLVLNTKSEKYLSERILNLYGNNFFTNLIPFYFHEGKQEAEGYISNFHTYRSNNSMIRFFINGRVIHYKGLIGLLKSAYGELMPPGRFPIAFIFFKLPKDRLDVNIHPQKKEIRFREEGKVRDFLYRAIFRAIEGDGFLKVSWLNSKKRSHFIPPSTTNIDSYQEQKTQLLTLQEVYSHGRQLENPTDFPDVGRKASISTQHHNFLFPSKLYTKLYDTFILGASEEGIFLLDQHTVHERINYEKTLIKLQKNENIGQDLLTPLEITLSMAEKTLILEKQALFNNLGFLLEDMGPAGLILKSIPFYIKTGEEEEALHIVLKAIETGTIDHIQLFEKMSASLACRQSIKKGDQESLFNLSELIDELKKCQNPARCPHGRPTIVFLDKKEISILFKRKT